jgi:hypothetical protein
VVALAVLPIQVTLRMRSFDRPLALALLGSHVVMLVASMGLEALYQRQWWMIIGLAMVQRPSPGPAQRHAPTATPSSAPTGPDPSRGFGR